MESHFTRPLIGSLSYTSLTVWKNDLDLWPMTRDFSQIYVTTKQKADIVAARCISAAYAVIQCLCVCLFVRPSRSWIVSKRINISLIFFTVSRSTILVFPYQTAWQYSDRNPPNGGVECGWGRQKRDFEPISGFTACCEPFQRQVQ